MKIAPKIIGIFLPLFTVPLIFVTYLSISAGRQAVTTVATNFLKFKAEELQRFASSEYSLLSDNNLQGNPNFVTAAKSAVANYASGLVQGTGELIVAFDTKGAVQFSTSKLHLTKSETKSLLDLVDKRTSGWVQLTVGGNVMVADLSYFKPFGWAIIVADRRSTFFAPVDRITLESTVTGLVSIAAVILLVVVFSRLLTFPLIQVVTAMRNIVRTGDLTRRVEVRYTDEVGELGESFNSMTGALEQAYDEIKNYALQAAIAERRESKIRNVFQKYVPTQVIEQYFRAPESMLIGEERALTVLFADIKGFTALSEKMSSHEIVESLNRYFDGMVDAVMRNEGLVDKYIGDAVMAFFGAPAVDLDSAYHAVLASFDMLERLAGFNKWQMSKGWSEVQCGIGVNYGPVTIGNIGSERKMDYTVVGDMVNVASRLEGLTRYYDENILVSESIFRFVRGRIHCRLVDRVQVKGRRRGLAVYGVRRTLSDAEERAWTLFDRGIQCYYTREFPEALRYFQAAARLVPGDLTARRFLRRSANFIKNPPDKDWTGVTAFDRK